MRLLVVHVPAFALERCGYDADELAAVIAEEKSAMRLRSLTPAARRAGLRVFMTATEARALVPDVELVPYDAEAEAQDRAALVQRYAELSDRVRAPWPDTLVAECGGTSRLFGGEVGLIERAGALAAQLGHRARVAVVDDALTGRALLHWGCEGVVPPGQGGQALASLPIVALEPSEALRGSLQAVGVERIADFARLSRPAVANRFGEEGVRLHRVARGEAVGGVDWRLDDDGPLSVQAALAGATSTLQLNFVLPGLLSALSKRLGSRGLAAIRLRVLLHLEAMNGGPRRASVGVTVGRPTRDPQTLERLVRLRLEGTQLEAPVDELCIEVVESTPEVGWQPGLTDRTEATEPLPDVLARLADHLGAEALCGAAMVERWKPEAAWVPAPWPSRQLLAPRRLKTTSRASAASVDPVVAQQREEAPVFAPRPTVLLVAPSSIEVRLTPAGAPVAMRVDGAWVSVDRTEGPERLRSDWWRSSAWSRDYWVVRCDGQTAWIYADDRGKWFLHGWFD